MSQLCTLDGDIQRTLAERDERIAALEAENARLREQVEANAPKVKLADTVSNLPLFWELQRFYEGWYAFCLTGWGCYGPYDTPQAALDAAGVKP
jgi:hypothetical protein